MSALSVCGTGSCRQNEKRYACGGVPASRFIRQNKKVLLFQCHMARKRRYFIYMIKKRNSEALFVHPFNRDYWRLACAELKDIRMLAIAAVVIAVRVALNPFAVKLIPNILEIKLSFWINAAGAMIYGPVVGALSGAVSDTLSCILFPSGPYFFPFIFVEMAGSFFFALVLYRTKLSATRIILSRAAVCVGCNFILNPLVMVFYYKLYLPSSYSLYLLVLTMFKNLLLFPLEALVLVIFISAIVPALKPFGLVARSQPKLYLKKSHYVFLGVLFVLSVVVLLLIYRTDLYATVRDFLKSWLK